MKIVALALLLSACASAAEMAAKPPSAVVQSAKAHDAIAECLLNRLSSDELIPKKEIGPDATTVSFAAYGMAAQPAVYVFVIHDALGGSTVYVHRLGKATLATAETCF